MTDGETPLLGEIDEAILWVKNEYGFVTDVLKKCRAKFAEQRTNLMVDEPPPLTMVDRMRMARTEYAAPQQPIQPHSDLNQLKIDMIAVRFELQAHCEYLVRLLNAVEKIPPSIAALANTTKTIDDGTDQLHDRMRELEGRLEKIEKVLSKP